MQAERSLFFLSSSPRNTPPVSNNDEQVPPLRMTIALAVRSLPPRSTRKSEQSLAPTTGMSAHSFYCSRKSPPQRWLICSGWPRVGRYAQPLPQATGEVDPPWQPISSPRDDGVNAFLLEIDIDNTTIPKRGRGLSESYPSAYKAPLLVYLQLQEPGFHCVVHYLKPIATSACVELSRVGLLAHVAMEKCISLRVAM